MSKSESVCLVGGEEIPAHQRMYVFLSTNASMVPPRVPGRVCIEHGGNGHNTFTPARYYAMVANAVIVEYDRMVMHYRTPDHDVRREVAFNWPHDPRNVVDGGAVGEALEVALDMGYDQSDDGVASAVTDAVRRLQVYYRAHYSLRQGASLAEVLEAFHAWDAQKVALDARDNGDEDEIGETIPDEWHQSNDDAVELLQRMAGLVAAGEVIPHDTDACKHERKTYDSGTRRVNCECGQYWPTFVIGD